MTPVLARIPGIDDLRESPRLGLWLRDLQDFFRAEQRAREAFVDSVDEGVKAEFINGETIVHSPAKVRHLDAVTALGGLLSACAAAGGGGKVFIEKAMISLTRNDYEPDVVWFGPEKAAALKPEQLRLPAPDFVAEVLSESTEARDRGVKFDDYAAHGVAEYWIVDPVAETIERNLLRGDRYEPGERVADGTIRSVAVPDFEISVRAIFDRDVHTLALREIPSKASPS